MTKISGLILTYFNPETKFNLKIMRYCPPCPMYTEAKQNNFSLSPAEYVACVIFDFLVIGITHISLSHFNQSISPLISQRLLRK